MKKIALISVSDKTDIDSFASQLVKNDYTIISTGGTAKYLKDKGIDIIPISKFTQFERNTRRPCQNPTSYNTCRDFS